VLPMIPRGARAASLYYVTRSRARPLVEENRQNSREEEKPGGASGKAQRHRASYGRVRRAPESRRTERCSDPARKSATPGIEARPVMCATGEPNSHQPSKLMPRALSFRLASFPGPVRQVADGSGECRSALPTTNVRKEDRRCRCRDTVFGAGPPLIIVGAFNDRSTGAPLANVLASDFATMLTAGTAVVLLTPRTTPHAPMGCARIDD
jgi:hypothetical protein